MNHQPDSEEKYSLLLEENKRLQSVIGELSILNEIATAISSAHSLDEVERLIIKKMVKHLRVEEGIVMLLEDLQSERPFQTMLRTKDSLLGTAALKLDDQIMGWMLVHKAPLLTNNLKDDARFKMIADSEFPIRSLLCAPLMIKAKLIGLIALFNKTGNDFTDNDQRLLTICAAQSAQILENARLYQHESALKKIKEEMKLASQIQTNLLPGSVLNINGFSILGNMIPAKEVGGDFYDYVSLPGNRIASWLGDISGKGIPASMLMANLQGVLRTRSMIDDTCVKCVGEANEILSVCSESDKFATLFYSILDLNENKITFISAGHTNIILQKENQEIQIFESADIPIGIYGDYKFSETQIELNAGDSLIIYSDGITEAENEKEELFGDQRLLEVIKSNWAGSAKDLMDEIFKAVQNFSKNNFQSDDQTIVIIKREY